ncbi:MAG: hypothetical protein M0010_18825 [Actinomycetota bacterium]|nr:hypothetical protein [Actinomycetota bacterium]
MAEEPASQTIPLPPGVSEIAARSAGVPGWALVQAGHWSPGEKRRVKFVQWTPPSVVVWIVAETVSWGAGAPVTTTASCGPENHDARIGSLMSGGVGPYTTCQVAPALEEYSTARRLATQRTDPLFTAAFVMTLGEKTGAAEEAGGTELLPHAVSRAPVQASTDPITSR